VSEWGDMSIRELLLQCASTIKIQLRCWSSTKWASSSSHWKLTCSRHDIAENCWIGIKHSLAPIFDWLIVCCLRSSSKYFIYIQNDNQLTISKIPTYTQRSAGNISCTILDKNKLTVSKQKLHNTQQKILHDWIFRMKTSSHIKKKPTHKVQRKIFHAYSGQKPVRHGHSVWQSTWLKCSLDSDLPNVCYFLHGSEIQDGPHNT